MNIHLTCGNCSHYDATHALCPLYTVDAPVGEVYLKRMFESPACTKYEHTFPVQVFLDQLAVCNTQSRYPNDGAQ